LTQLRPSYLIFMSHVEQLICLSYHYNFDLFGGRVFLLVVLFWFILLWLGLRIAM
jgi:hypothetical protein